MRVEQEGMCGHTRPRCESAAKSDQFRERSRTFTEELLNAENAFKRVNRDDE